MGCPPPKKKIFFVKNLEGEGESIEDRFKASYDDRFDYCLHSHHQVFFEPLLHIINDTLIFERQSIHMKVSKDFQHAKSSPSRGTINYVIVVNM
jgi:hypothetical protein